MHQNNVKTETGKTTTFIEREVTQPDLTPTPSPSPTPAPTRTLTPTLTPTLTLIIWQVLAMLHRSIYPQHGDTPPS